ncbi:hypothetical protein RFI_20720 [Reticulomyxa filosa]|uniref:Uncharacterized protein n=1 Tax=Reticulomyxa filosa TaxID=46433 RepID=X6MS05_RETFI|nr:hypothetical protein RFI_20720 [Reticulomyxa filosa]|eukprot:ETO16619.1 hypothetical protein RFI_20720 [Reticulomyxa filosa]
MALLPNKSLAKSKGIYNLIVYERTKHIGRQIQILQKEERRKREIENPQINRCVSTIESHQEVVDTLEYEVDASGEGYILFFLARMRSYPTKYIKNSHTIFPELHEQCLTESSEPCFRSVEILRFNSPLLTN